VNSLKSALMKCLSRDVSAVLFIRLLKGALDDKGQLCGEGTGKLVMSL